jgi:signal transduction histidine kinase
MLILPAKDDAHAADVATIARLDVVNRILEVVCRVTGMGFAAIARVTETRWVACAVRDEISFGLAAGGELRIETTICNEVRTADQAVAIADVSADECFRDHPTPKLYGFQSYVSVPIRLPESGAFFGTLCAIDPRPSRVDRPETVEMFRLFADLIAMHIDSQRRLDASEAALLDAREAAQLRDQFIAVLGHDLRNPIAAVSTGAELLARQPQTERGQAILGMMRSSVRRMLGLVDDVLDFARGRLGGGLSVRVAPAPDLEQRLRHVVNELRAAHPRRTIRDAFALASVVTCDPARVGQMLSNLLANALTHGDPAGEVVVRATSGADGFEMSVTNPGATIPAAVLDRLFQPFVRGDANPGKQGLGLGLYIASEIARAHGGTLRATSCDGVTCFVFAMPTSA